MFQHEAEYHPWTDPWPTYADCHQYSYDLSGHQPNRFVYNLAIQLLCFVMLWGSLVETKSRCLQSKADGHQLVSQVLLGWWNGHKNPPWLCFSTSQGQSLAIPEYCKTLNIRENLVSRIGHIGSSRALNFRESMGRGGPQLTASF